MDKTNYIPPRTNFTTLIVGALLVLYAILTSCNNESRQSIIRIAVEDSNRISVELKDGAYDYLTKSEFKLITGIELNITK